MKKFEPNMKKTDKEESLTEKSRHQKEKLYYYNIYIHEKVIKEIKR